MRRSKRKIEPESSSKISRSREPRKTDRLTKEIRKWEKVNASTLETRRVDPSTLDQSPVNHHRGRRFTNASTRGPIRELEVVAQVEAAREKIEIDIHQKVDVKSKELIARHLMRSQ